MVLGIAPLLTTAVIAFLLSESESSTPTDYIQHSPPHFPITNQLENRQKENNKQQQKEKRKEKEEKEKENKPTRLSIPIDREHVQRPSRIQ
jgi:hypothetical protein